MDYLFYHTQKIIYHSTFISNRCTKTYKDITNKKWFREQKRKCLKNLYESHMLKCMTKIVRIRIKYSILNLAVPFELFMTF